MTRCPRGVTKLPFTASSSVGDEEKKKKKLVAAGTAVEHDDAKMYTTNTGSLFFRLEAFRLQKSHHFGGHRMMSAKHHKNKLVDNISNAGVWLVPIF